MTRPPRTIAALIRHGDYHQLPDTPSAHQPFPLSELGRRQSRAAGERLGSLLQGEGWHLAEEVDASELLRAWQTAAYLCDGLVATTRHLRIASFMALAERGLGTAANLSAEQIHQVVAADPRCGELPEDWKSSPHFCLPLPGAESLTMAGERVARHLETRMQALAEEVSRDTVKLFVGHGAAFRHAAHHLGVLAAEDIPRLSMYHAAPVLVERLTDGRWQRIAGHWKVRQRDEGHVD
ncbi:histidine phosphatase family protein [Halomonas sp. 18H]|uniref:histidine phosphatase family protein n=1 Tax=Halomonas almeriensis TaxID=308163 RepID=UPI0022327E33|nr:MULTISPECIES: histidine phosphatase family protein [Halomonas]MCW4149781.1 histidine phosphatase family protein [Halomonas sp. 18H]MDN3553258.1 histidine phosphatase family protein [Halomonas almeriensis]